MCHVYIYIYIYIKEDMVSLASKYHQMKWTNQLMQHTLQVDNKTPFYWDNIQPDSRTNYLTYV